MIALNVGDNVTLRYLRTTLGIDLDNLATESSWYLNKFAPRSLDVAENVAFLILLADERLDSRCALAFARELPVDVALNGSNDGVSLGVLVSAELLGRKIGAELGVLELLEVSEEVYKQFTSLIAE